MLTFSYFHSQTETFLLKSLFSIKGKIGIVVSRSFIANVAL